MNRRNFITTACLTCAGVGVIRLLQGCTTHRYITDYIENEKKLTIKKSVFTVIKKQKAVQQKYVLLKPGSFQFPIALYKLNEKEYKAFLLRCTHQGCELNAYESMMVCPCHGAEFNTKGEVTQGPAEIDLTVFVTMHDDENIYIQY